MNERLRTAMLRRGVGPHELAESRGVDPKTVERWISIRASVPRETLLRLMTDAQDHIDVLVFSGTFFAQTQPRVAAMLAERMTAGVQVRLCFGQPSGDAIANRDREEGLGGTLGAKIRASLTYYRELADRDGCEIRLHDTTLYASMFRYDDELLANPHVWANPPASTPPSTSASSTAAACSTTTSVALNGCGRPACPG